MIETLARASGSLGMAGGQATDMAAQGKTLDTEALATLHLGKTGALIRPIQNAQRGTTSFRRSAN